MIMLINAITIFFHFLYVIPIVRLTKPIINIISAKIQKTMK